MELPRHVLKQLQHPNKLMSGNETKFSNQVIEIARMDVESALKKLDSRASGFSAEEAEKCAEQFGLNEEEKMIAEGK
jgi:hypothetical protein